MAVEKGEANDFWENYAKICSTHKTYPLNSVMKQRKSLELTCAIKLIRAQHCSLIMEALSLDKTLTAINFFVDISEAAKAKEIGKSYFFPVPLFLYPKNLFITCSALKSCLNINQNLKILKLEKLPLSLDHVKILSEGLKNCTSLQEFSLAGCCIGDDAAELLFDSLKYVINIHWVNVSFCDLSVKTAIAISSMLKFQSIMYHTDVWKESLRYSKPILDNSRGIDRISLNNNVNLGDKAIDALMESLTDDLWLKALDLRKCNIGINGAIAVLKILKSNCILETLDLRYNDISKEIQEQIDLQLSLNNAGKILKYEQLPLPVKTHSKRRVCSTAKAFKTKSSTKVRISYATKKKSSNKGNNILRKDNTLCRSQCETHRDLKLKGDVTNVSSLKDSEYMYEINRHLISKVEKLKKSLHKEKKRRKYVQDQLHKLQAKNKILHEEMMNSRNMTPGRFTLIDELTYLDIQETFSKFSNFLKLIGESGLQDLVPSSLKYALRDQASAFK